MSSNIHIACALGLASCLGALACTDTDVPTSIQERAVMVGATPSELVASGADLAALRRATARLHRFENAGPAGWDLQVTGCMEHPSEGGMGYHYGNLGYYLDGEVKVSEPEILLYEPQRNGKLRLVAVEYAVPFFAWPGDPDVDDPPRLFGRDMKRVDVQGEWQLHVWVWKHNPAGIFEDWNPRVGCDHPN